MDEMEDKGPLIKKKSRKNDLERPQPVIKNKEYDFDPYLTQKEKEPIDKPAIDPPQPQVNTTNNRVELKPQAITPNAKAAPLMKSIDRMNKPVNNSERMIKMSKELHISIMSLGSFMGEKKGYDILEKLVEHYTEHQLTERQKDQFKFLTQILADEKKQ